MSVEGIQGTIHYVFSVYSPQSLSICFQGVRLFPCFFPLSSACMYPSSGVPQFHHLRRFFGLRPSAIFISFDVCSHKCWILSLNQCEVIAVGENIKSGFECDWAHSSIRTSPCGVLRDSRWKHDFLHMHLCLMCSCSVQVLLFPNWPHSESSVCNLIQETIPTTAPRRKSTVPNLSLFMMLETHDHVVMGGLALRAPANRAGCS